jgi:hypothetical protein
MSMGGPPEDVEGPGRGPDLTEAEIQRLMREFEEREPEAFAELFAGRLPAPRAARRSRWPAVVAVVVLVLAVVGLSPVPRIAAETVDALAGHPGAPLAEKLAAQAPTASPLPGGRLAAAVPVTGVPPAGTWAYLQTQPGSSAPVTYDPCRPIHYVVRDHEGAGSRGVEVVHDAVAAVSAATGLVFVDDGMTDEAPSPNRPASIPGRYSGRWAPVLIAWSDPDEYPALAGRTAGLGGSVSVREPGGRAGYVSGQIALDTPDLAGDLGFLGRRDLVTAVVMHELGHVVGADHAPDGSQLMSAENTGRTDWNDGDRYVLATLGQGRCGSGP